MTSREQQIKKLYEVLLAVYTKKNDSRPAVAAQFHLEGFVSQNRNDQKWFDELLQMEIEDCSRALA